MAKSKILHQCLECQNSYYGWTGNRGKYCSRTCYHKGDRRRAIERFWQRVNKIEGGCWEWLGPIVKAYGKTGIGPAHQVAWEATNGQIPNDLQVCHKCNNPPCCNPAHLYLGTPADNMRDRQEAGHYDRGEQHPMAILSEVAVLKIRSLYIPRKNGVTTLGKQFGVAPTTIHAIVTRKIWKHI